MDKMMKQNVPRIVPEPPLWFASTKAARFRRSSVDALKSSPKNSDAMAYTTA
jgi:hypothetical protein